MKTYQKRDPKAALLAFRPDYLKNPRIRRSSVPPLRRDRPPPNDCPLYPDPRRPLPLYERYAPYPCLPKRKSLLSFIT